MYNEPWILNTGEIDLHGYEGYNVSHSYLFKLNSDLTCSHKAS